MPDIPQNIPPQVLAALQQQQGGMNGGDITSILAQLAQMSPDELSQALGQLGVNIPPDQLVNAAENWLEGAADKQASAGDEAETPAEAATPNEEDTEGADRTRGIDPADQEEADQAQPEEESALPPGATPTGYSPQAQLAGSPPAPTAAPQGAAPMPVSGGGRLPPAAAMRGAASGQGGTMDDLISAAMMQRAAGDPNAAVPMPRMRGAKPPGPGVAATALGNVRQRSMSPRSSKRG